MDAMRECCCGIDVHHAILLACLLKGPLNIEPEPQIKEFGATLSEIIKVRDWLLAEGCKDVAFESTGIYWRPVYNVLHKTCDITLGNAAHIKNLPDRRPGHKTDKDDALRISKLHRCGLIRKSFIAPPEIQELRDLTRYRKKLVGQVTSERNRIIKVLESANIKISICLSDVFGVSGRSILESLIAGEIIDAARLKDLVDKKLHKKIPELADALNGEVTKHHREMLNYSYEHLQYLEASIQALEKDLHQKIKPFEQEVIWLDTIPGVAFLGAATILAEIGNDMSMFPSDSHLASWSGVSPGNNESGGKRKKSRVSRGHKWIRRALLESAWAARNTKTYLGAKFRAIARRHGSKNAAVVIAHKIIVAAYHILKERVPYQELGQPYLDSRRKVSRESQSILYLKKLGYTVILTPKPEQEVQEEQAIHKIEI